MKKKRGKLGLHLVHASVTKNDGPHSGRAVSCERVMETSRHVSGGLSIGKVCRGDDGKFYYGGIGTHGAYFGGTKTKLAAIKQLVKQHVTWIGTGYGGYVKYRRGS